MKVYEISLDEALPSQFTGTMDEARDFLKKSESDEGFNTADVLIIERNLVTDKSGVISLINGIPVYEEDHSSEGQLILRTWTLTARGGWKEQLAQGEEAVRNLCNGRATRLQKRHLGDARIEQAVQAAVQTAVDEAVAQTRAEHEARNEAREADEFRETHAAAQPTAQAQASPGHMGAKHASAAGMTPDLYLQTQLDAERRSSMQARQMVRELWTFMCGQQSMLAMMQRSQAGLLGQAEALLLHRPMAAMPVSADAHQATHDGLSMASQTPYHAPADALLPMHQPRPHQPWNPAQTQTVQAPQVQEPQARHPLQVPQVPPPPAPAQAPALIPTAVPAMMPAAMPAMEAAAKADAADAMDAENANAAPESIAPESIAPETVTVAEVLPAQHAPEEEDPFAPFSVAPDAGAAAEDAAVEGVAADAAPIPAATPAPDLLPARELARKPRSSTASPLALDKLFR